MRAPIRIKVFLNQMSLQMCPSSIAQIVKMRKKLRSCTVTASAQCATMCNTRAAMVLDMSPATRACQGCLFWKRNRNDSFNLIEYPAGTWDKFSSSCPSLHNSSAGSITSGVGPGLGKCTLNRRDSFVIDLKCGLASKPILRSVGNLGIQFGKT